MRLKKLHIRSFKGLDELTIEPDGQNLVIRGKNGTGKTTIADAYSWLMTGKGFDGKTIDTQIKRRAADGSTPNDGGVEHTVEGTFILDDGRETTFSRTLKEKWEKKRGTAEQEFRGHTTCYKIDEVLMLKRVWDQKLEELTGGEKAFQLLSMPLSFCSLRWDKRREILTEISGTVTDADIIAGDKELAPLTELLDGHDVADFRKIVQSKAKKVNEEIKTIPARIDELTQMQENGQAGSKEDLEQRLAGLREEYEKQHNELYAVQFGGTTIPLRKELAAVENDIYSFTNAFDSKYNREADEADRKGKKALAEIKQLMENTAKAGQQANDLKALIQEDDRKAEEMRGAWREENARKADINVEDTCPYCGQVLPPEKVEEIEKKAVEDFLGKKAAKLREINDLGKKIVARRKKNEAAVKQLEADNEQRLNQIEERRKIVAETAETLQKLQALKVEEQPGFIELEKKEKVIQAKLEAESGDNAEPVKKLQRRLDSLAKEIHFVNESLASIKQQEQIASRVNELKEKETALGQEYSKLQGQLYLTEQFIRAKVRMTEDSINSHFKYVRWKMFNQRINGALEECCEPLIDGVPYSDGLNKGNRMKAALDILNTLSQFYQKKLPVIIDDGESYSSLPELDTQVIELIVDKSCDELQFEEK